MPADVEDDFHVPERSARAAVETHDAFNLIDRRSALKVDLFVLGDGVLDRLQLARRQSVALPVDPPVEVWVTSPEDVVLRKLRWFDADGQVSDRHWRDIVGVLRVQAGRLDDRYLSDTAGTVGLGPLLAEARRDAGRWRPRRPRWRAPVGGQRGRTATESMRSGWAPARAPAGSEGPLALRGHPRVRLAQPGASPGPGSGGGAVVVVDDVVGGGT